MRKTFQMIFVLTFVGLISGAALAFIYRYANPLIIENQKNETEQAIFKIFPDGKSYNTKTVKGEDLFTVKDKDNASLGYAFLAEGYGYQGTISIMAGIKLDLETLVGIEILESQETPGLGQEITQDKFKSQFKGLKTSPEITYTKDKKSMAPGEIQAITGATVSTNAVVSILNGRIKAIKESLGGAQ